ncbi:hypothetical protein ACJX0J_019303, partial [Zea mays]
YMIIWDNGYQLLVYTMRVLFLHLSAAGNTSIFVHTNVYTNLSLRCMYFVQIEGEVAPDSNTSSSIHLLLRLLNLHVTVLSNSLTDG